VAGGNKGGAKRPKTRGVKLEQRLDQVEKWIASGEPSSSIQRTCGKRWGISPSQAAEYIAKVYERWKAERHRDRPAARERQIRRLMRLYTRADVQKGGPHFRAMLRVEELLHRIEGTGYMPTDDLAGAGAVDIVIERNRNPDVPPPAALTAMPAQPAPPQKEA